MSNRKWGALLISVLAGVLVWNWIQGRDGEPVLTEHSGYEAYREYCRKCHGNRGDGARARRMAKRPLSLFDPTFRDTTDLGEAIEIVERGRGRMKGYSERLLPGEIESVSRYVLEMPSRAEVP